MSGDRIGNFEVVIGLEVHAQLRTKSKLFSPAPVSFGERPNHSVALVCLALPGVLPVLNARAVELAIRASLATHCTVQPHSVFERKNYFYPDLPKGYQISQFAEPLATGGWIEIPVEDAAGGASTRRIRLTRIHMEEDAGKSIHDAGIAGAHATLVDLNRSGVPLIEIVSEPDLRSAADVGAYLRTLRSIVRYTGVSDADMEKGHFRCDVNISLRPVGSQEYGTRTELKNLNSFRFIEEAIAAETRRQAEILEGGGEIVQCTLAYDPRTRLTRVLRLKEDADDYRYFPDPDLIPVVVSEEQIERIRAQIPELAAEKCQRFQRELGVAESTARQLTAARAVAEFFEAAARSHGDAVSVANWILRDVAQSLKESELEIEDSELSPQALAALIQLVDRGVTTAKSARGLLTELVERGGDPVALVRERGLEAVSDAGIIEQAVAEALAEHPDNVEKYRAGEEKVVNFLMGQVMRRTQGKANPTAVREILVRELGK